MGSDSDLAIMAESAQVLEDFGVSYEITVASAHRSPLLTHKYAQNALNRGFKVIIAGAGGAAHLAGVIASFYYFTCDWCASKNKNFRWS